MQGKPAPGNTIPDVEVRSPRRWPLRRGRALLPIGIAILVSALLGAVFLAASWRTGSGEAGGPMLVHTIERGPFVSVVTESGDIESASNDEVRCEVKSVGGGSGTTLLEIVDEGTLVKKGDFLLQFDAAALEQSLTEQEIVVATDRAGVIGAQSDLDKAVHALREYQKGTFLVEQELLEGELFLAESHLKSGLDSLSHAARMFRKGYVSRVQLDAESLSVETARKNVQAAHTKLKVLRELTFARMVAELKADVEKQKAMRTAAEYRLKLSQQRRNELSEQVAKCRCVAPRGGLVVYANDLQRQIVIEEGAQIREGQVVIRLPDPKQMQLDTKINDSKINRVRVGSPAEIILDVDPTLEIRGEVAKVEEFPFPRRWHGAPIEYGARIRIIDPPRSLRPGQRAKVKIYVERQKEVLLAPIQSVVVRASRQFCLVKEGADCTPREIKVGPSNDSFVVVTSGLQEGEQVLLNPDAVWDELVKDPDLKSSQAGPTVAAAAAR